MFGVRHIKFDSMTYVFHFKIGITAGVIKNQDYLTVESFMPTKGVIFSDGIESDFLNFNSGSIATIGIAKEIAQLVVKGNKGLSVVS